MTATRLANLVEQLRDEQHHYVDARQWDTNWSESWVSFSDIIGFAHRCMRSPESVVNAIVRFHRSVSASRESIDAGDLRVFQFTDAAFAASADLEAIIRFTTTLHHHCLAHNSIQHEDNDHVLAHFLLPIRSTIGFGRVLRLPERTYPEQRTLGVDPGSLLAGDGIVKAYRAESASVANLLSVTESAGDRVSNHEVSVRGETSRARQLVERWFRVEGGDYFRHDSVIDFPWYFLRPVQDRDEIWVDSLQNVRRKMLRLLEDSELIFSEFVTQQGKVSTAKHYTGMLRHLIEAEQRLEGVEHLQRWGATELREALEDHID